MAVTGLASMSYCIFQVGYPRLLEMSGASFYIYRQPLHSNPKCLDLCGVLQATAYFQKPWTANLRNTAQRTAGWLRESLITLLLGHWLVQTARPPLGMRLICQHNIKNNRASVDSSTILAQWAGICSISIINHSCGNFALVSSQSSKLNATRTHLLNLL